MAVCPSAYHAAHAAGDSSRRDRPQRCEAPSVRHPERRSRDVPRDTDAVSDASVRDVFVRDVFVRDVSVSDVSVSDVSVRDVSVRDVSVSDGSGPADASAPPSAENSSCAASPARASRAAWLPLVALGLLSRSSRRRARRHP